MRYDQIIQVTIQYDFNIKRHIHTQSVHAQTKKQALFIVSILLLLLLPLPILPVCLFIIEACIIAGGASYSSIYHSLHTMAVVEPRRAKAVSPPAPQTRNNR